MPALPVHPVFVIVAAGALLCVFARALMHKLSDFGWFSHTLEGYRIVSPKLAPIVAVALAVAEGAVILGLIVPAARPFAAGVAFALLAVYGAAIALNLLRGNRRIECGCGGAGQGLSWFLVLRNALLALLAVVAAAVPTAEPIGVLGWISTVTGIAAVMLVIAGAEQLNENWTWLLASNETRAQGHSGEEHRH